MSFVDALPEGSSREEFLAALEKDLLAMGIGPDKGPYHQHSWCCIRSGGIRGGNSKSQTQHGGDLAAAIVAAWEALDDLALTTITGTSGDGAELYQLIFDLRHKKARDSYRKEQMWAIQRYAKAPPAGEDPAWVEHESHQQLLDLNTEGFGGFVDWIVENCRLADGFVMPVPEGYKLGRHLSYGGRRW